MCGGGQVAATSLAHLEFLLCCNISEPERIQNKNMLSIHSPRRPKQIEIIITRYDRALLLICDVIQAFSNFLFRLVI